MELNKAEIFYGALLEGAAAARTQMVLENGDALTFGNNLPEEVLDEFKAISVITSVAFRQLVKAGYIPKDVPDKPGFVQVTLNNKTYMCLASVLQGTLENAISKAALKEEADKLGLNSRPKTNEPTPPVSTTTINNNGINAEDLAEIVKAAVSAVTPTQPVIMQPTPLIESPTEIEVVSFNPSDFETEYKTPAGGLLFEINKIMYSSHQRTMREITVYSAPLQVYGKKQDNVPIFVYVESDEEITYASAYDYPDGKIKISIADIDLLVSGSFDSYGGYHMAVESLDPYIKLITMDRKTSGNAAVANNGHPKFGFNDNEIIVDVIPIGALADEFIVIQKIGDEVSYIQVGEQSNLNSALVFSGNATYNITPEWEGTTLVVHI